MNWNQYKWNPIPLSLDQSKPKAIFNFWKQNQWKIQICFSMIKSKLLFVTKDKQTIYSFQRMVKAFKAGA